MRDWRFTTAAVLILGLAIGANTAIFSVVNAVLFRDSPFADPDRLVNIYQNDPAGKPLVVVSTDSTREMARYRHLCGDDGRHDSGFGPLSPRRRIRSGTSEYATATYLDVLGLRPSLGRWFDATEERPGLLVAVLGYQAWTRVFRGSSILGRIVRIEGAPVTIVGIGPANHRGTLDVGLGTDFWLPMTALRELNAMPAMRAGADHRALFRESPSARGVTVAQAKAAMDVLAPRLAACRKRFATAPSSPSAQASRSSPRRTCGSTRRRTRRSWRSRRGARVVGLVLAIACSNLATLLLVRGAARTKKSRCGWPWAPRGVSSSGTC